jgi:hypothetical protein
MSSRVTTASNLFDYFHTRVEDVRATRPVRISSDTSLYLTSLLVDRARADRPTAPEQTLAELYGRAANAPPAEQARAYRELGDRALYLLGYFAESLRRRTVGPTYYADMGAAAYHRVDQVFKKWFADAFGPVFGELALRFEDCVHLLEAVREVHRRDHPDETLLAYERWLASGSEPDASRLRALGLILPPSGSNDA